jgi:tetratricopeptide (TPR) repeat protein
LQQADQLLRSQRPSEAIQLLAPVVAAQPGHGAANRMLAFAYLSQGDFASALEPAQRAAALLPQDADAQYAAGFALFKAERGLEAIERLEAARAIQPQHDPAKTTLIETLLEEGKRQIDIDHRRAEDLLERAQKMDRRNPRPIVALLDLWQETQQRQKAIGFLEKLDTLQLRDPIVEAKVEALKQDPNYTALMKMHASSIQSSSKVAAPVAPTGPIMVTCPQCKQKVLETAPTCPYCRAVLRPIVQQRGKLDPFKLSWQERAYTVMCWIYILLNAIVLIAGVVAYSQSQASGTIDVASGVVGVAVGIGLLVRNEWVMYIAKIILWLSVGLSALMLLLTLMTFRGLDSFVALLLILFRGSLNGFMLYLIDYEGG